VTTRVRALRIGYEAFDVADPLADDCRTCASSQALRDGDVLIDEAWLPESTGVRSIIATR